MAKPVDLAYIDKQEPAQRELLLELRRLILAVAPKAEPRIAWGMPTYEVCGYVVGICGFKKHVSLFPGGAVTALFASELEHFTTSKGTIQFALDAKLPVTLIKQIVKFRLAENIEKASVVPIKDGKAHGKAREYYADGTLKAEGSYRAGARAGEWRYFSKDGALTKTKQF